MIQQTVAFDERDVPSPWPDYEWLVVGPHNTVAKCAELRAPGTKLCIKVQPVRWFNPDGTPRRNSQWDNILATLPYLESPTLDLPGDGMAGSKLLDFAKITALSSTLVSLCQQRGALGVLFDYGCNPPANGLSQAWIDGYNAYRYRVSLTGLHTWNACNKQQPTGGCMFESIAATTGDPTGWPPGYAQLRAASGQPMYLIQNDDVKHRRIICGIALENGALVNYRPQFAADRWQNLVPPELVF